MPSRRRLTSLFAVQDAAAEHVAHALDVELGGADRALLARRDTSDVLALPGVPLKGRYFWSRFTGEGGWGGRSPRSRRPVRTRSALRAAPRGAGRRLPRPRLLRAPAAERGLAPGRGVGAHRAAGCDDSPGRRPHLAGLRAAVPRLGLGERPRVAEARAGAEPAARPRTSGTASSSTWKAGSTTRGARSSARWSWSRCRS